MGTNGDWVAVAEAAQRAGVETKAVRRWARAGVVASTRRPGGGYVVALSDVILATAAAAEAAARQEVRRLTADLEDAARQIDAARQRIKELRTQNAEAAEEARELRETIAELQEELAEARRAATFGSVTTTSWMDDANDGYRGPVRPQAPLGGESDGDVAGDDLLPNAAKARSGRKARNEITKS